MTCVWDSLIQGIPEKFFNNHSFLSKPTPPLFVRYPQFKNKKPKCIVINDQKIIEKGRKKILKPLKISK